MATRSCEPADPPPAEARPDLGATTARGGLKAGEVWEAYELWCSLLDLDEDHIPFQRIMVLITQGGETFRSFLQFLARIFEPHKGAWAKDEEVWEQEALRRSFVAMRIACRALACPSTSAGIEGTQVLPLVCHELLGGLQPRSVGSSLHICTVLQHLLSSHEKEVCPVLLSFHTPFILLRLLNQPGCQELLLGLLVGCDAPMLLPLVPNQTLRPLSADRMEQVLAYLRETQWPKMLATLLHHGALLGNGSAARGLQSPVKAPGRTGSPVRDMSPSIVSTPARRGGRRWPTSPCTPGWLSPGLGSGSGLTPQRLSTPTPTPGSLRGEAASPLQTMAAVPSSPSILQAVSPLRTLAIVPSSPSVLQEPDFTELPTFPVGVRPPQAPPPLRPRRRPTPDSKQEPPSCPSNAASGGNPAEDTRTVPCSQSTPESDIDASAARLASTLAVLPSPARTRLGSVPSTAPAPGVRPVRGPEASEPEEGGREGVGVLLEFLIAMVEACGRSSEALRRSRQQQQQRQLREAEALRAEEKEKREKVDNNEKENKEKERVQDSNQSVEDGICSQREDRAEVRVRLLEAMLLDAPLVSHIFELLHCCSAQLEVVRVLHLILQHVLSPKRDDRALLEPLLELYLPYTESLGTLLLQHSPGFKSNLQPRRRSQQPHRAGDSELRLNAYTVREPLGSLRVTAVQIIADVAELAPIKALPAIRPAVWELLVHWFLTHRCNHIFQVACGRLLTVVVQHGTSKLQHFIFVRCQLLSRLCDAILAEGACGDRWHELRPARDSRSARPRSSSPRAEKSEVSACRKRHPGGLASLVSVVLALAHSAAETGEMTLETSHRARTEVSSLDFALESAPAHVEENPGRADWAPPADRPPGTAPEMTPRGGPALGSSCREALRRPSMELPWEAKTEDLHRPVEPRQPPRAQSFLVKLLLQTPAWPQVLGALAQQVPRRPLA